jgi:hypothetical protein
MCYNPGASLDPDRSQKGNARSIPSIRAAGWGTRLTPGQKSSISCSILVRSRARLAGSNAADVFHIAVFISDFYLNIFTVTLFEPYNKRMIM